MLIALTEARDRIGVSKDVFRVLVKEGRFTIYGNPRDRRSKLVDTDELDTYLAPRIIRERKPDRSENRSRAMEEDKESGSPMALRTTS